VPLKENKGKILKYKVYLILNSISPRKMIITNVTFSNECFPQFSIEIQF